LLRLVKPPLATARAAYCIGAVHLFVCLSLCLLPKCKKTPFSQKLRNLELWRLMTTYRKFCNWALQRTHYWRTFGRIQWPVIPEPRITLKGAVTWRHQCHHRDTLQDVIIPSAILKIVFRHFIFFCFQCSLCFDERRLSYRLRYTCLLGNDKAGLNVKHDTCSSQSGLMMSRCLSLTH